MTSGQYSQVVQLSGDISSGSIHQQNSTISRTVFSPPLAVVVKYTKTGLPRKVRLEEHRKAVVRGEIEKSGMADHIRKEKGKPSALMG